MGPPDSGSGEAVTVFSAAGSSTEEGRGASVQVLGLGSLLSPAARAVHPLLGWRWACLSFRL